MTTTPFVERPRSPRSAPQSSGVLDALVVRLTQAEEELVGLGTREALRPATDPVLSDDQAAVRACLSRMLQLVDGVAA